MKFEKSRKEFYESEVRDMAAQIAEIIDNTEKEKSQASDSFKRACFNWGIGRELYSAPFIWVTAGKASIREDKNKKRLYCNDHFSVRSIGYNSNREINALKVVNDSSHGQVVYEMQAGNQAAGTGSIQLSLLERELERTGICLGTVLERYNIKSISQMTPEIYTNALNSLRKTKTKGAA